MKPKVDTDGAAASVTITNDSGNNNDSIEKAQTNDVNGRNPQTDRHQLESNQFQNFNQCKTMHHLSARILLTALEAQYEGSSCLTSSAASMASAVTTSKCSSSDSSWSVARAISTRGKQRPVPTVFSQNGTPSCGMSTRSLKRTNEGVCSVVPGFQQNTTKPIASYGQDKRIRNMKSGLAHGEVSHEAYEGSASSNNDCSDSENEMEFFDTAPKQKSFIFGARHLLGQARKDEKTTNADGGFKQENESGVACKRRRRKDMDTTTLDEAAARQGIQRRKLSASSFSKVSPGFMSANQTVENGISILERSVKSKLAAAGESSMRNAQLKKQRAHTYHEQAMSLAKGLAQSKDVSAFQVKKPITCASSAMMSQLQMHQVAGVPRRQPFKNNNIVLGAEQQVMIKNGPTPMMHGKSVDPRAPKAHIYNIGVDILVQCLSFLDPREVLSIVTCPLSKTWRQVYCKQDHLWKVLCLAEPFYARLGSSNSTTSGSGGDDSISMSTSSTASEMRNIFGQYRLLYTSFVRCIAYVNKIQREALIQSKKPTSLTMAEGTRDPAAATSSASRSISNPRAELVAQHNLPPSLGNFLALSRETASQQNANSSSLAGATLHVDSGAESPQSSLSNSCLSSSCSDSSDEGSDMEPERTTGHMLSSRNSSARAVESKSASGSSVPAPVTAPRYGHSKLTAGVLGTSSSNASKSKAPGHVDLPWSCAVYAVINWMVAFSDVLGIQVACLKVLPALLEDERQRSTAQLAGLTGIVIRAMVCFKDSVELHTASFHTLVLLARPLGGKEGMLFHRTMVGGAREEPANRDGAAIEANQPQGNMNRQQPRGIFDIGSAGQGNINGTAVILDSMRRFAANESLQAMACWSMVNIALIPSQKSMLVRLGGIGVTAQAMMMHPLSAEVQFRALFALINLVIPCEQTASVRVSVEKQMLDESVGQIVHLVVAAMKVFCTTKAILNRACLVLHNLSLNREYHSTLLWAPNCYEMVQWTMANYPNDRVIEQSTSGTLQRLQQTLREDDDLRVKFSAWLNTPVPAISSAP